MKNVFIERLKLARGHDSQVVFSGKLGYSQSAYARYETGKGLPSIEQLYNICSKAKISADWLLGLEDKSSKESFVLENSTPYGFCGMDSERFLGVVESQQRVIESQAKTIERLSK